MPDPYALVNAKVHTRLVKVRLGFAVRAATDLCLMCAWLVLDLCTRCNMLILCTNTIVRNSCTKFVHKVAQKGTAPRLLGAEDTHSN